MSVFSKVYPKRDFGTKNVWYPGFWLKVPESAMTNTSTTAVKNSWAGIGGVLDVLEGNPNWRCAQLQVLPSLVCNGENNFDWSYYEEKRDDLAARGVKMCLMFQQRQFNAGEDGDYVSSEVDGILPAYLFNKLANWNTATAGTTVPANKQGGIWEGVFMINPGVTVGSSDRGNYLDTRNAKVVKFNRDMFASCARVFNNDPHTIAVGTSESSYGTPTHSFGVSYNGTIWNAASEQSFWDSRISMLDDMKAAFTKTMVWHDGNHPRVGFLEQLNAVIVSKGIAASNSNSGWSFGMNDTNPNSLGALTYYEGFGNQIPILAGWQGQDMRDDNPDTGLPPTAQEFYDRVSSAYINASQVIVQYTNLTTNAGVATQPGATFDEMNNLIRSLPVHGGLRSTKPTRVI